MALRLRRGTDAERQLITPAEGELIYTTDTKSVYIGDGATVGGTIISGEIGLGDLAEVDLSTPPTVGQVLKWDGSQFVPSSDIEGSTYTFNQNDVSNNGHPINFSTTQAGTHQGGVAFVDNVRYYLDDVLISGPAAYNAGFNAAVTRRVEITVTSATPNTLYYYCYNHPVMAENAVINVVSTGTVAQDRTFIVTVAVNAQPPGQNVYVIDGAQYPDLQFVVGSNIISSIFDLNDVFSFTPPDANDVLTFDGVNFTPRKITQIEGADSSLMLDATTNTFTGNFIGDGSGLTNLPGGNGDGVIEGSNYRINIVGDDNSLIVNAATNTITGTFVGDGSQLTSLPTEVISVFDLNDVFSFTPPDPNDILTFDGFNFVPRKITSIEGADSSIMLDTSTNTFTGTFVGDASQLTNLPLFNNSVFDLNDVFQVGQLEADDLLVWDGFNFINQQIGDLINLDEISLLNVSIIGDDSTLLVDTSTNTLQGTLFGDVAGSVFNDLYTLVDATTGIITARHILLGADVDVPVGVNGMIIYNNSINKFQGYANGVWVDLH